ncbi:MAG: acetoin utilization protein AcuC [Coriobacteriia bacterium]
MEETRTTATLVWSPETARYDFGAGHPLAPVRVTLAVALMRAYSLLGPEGPVAVVAPRPASRDELAAVHEDAYLEAVREAAADPAGFEPRRGVGDADDPAFRGMDEAAALVAGGSIVALETVLGGGATRSFAVAGGLHHAHAGRAAGFCVYNDPAVAIAAALRRDPALRVAYLDIDAHHGDGVQEAFWDDPRVITVSIHESGAYLFPGTGDASETGGEKARGSAVNVGLPPFADDACYAAVFDEIVEPVVGAFSPDVIVAQLGCDAHHADPLTHLSMTLPGYLSLVGRIVALADSACAGRLAALGGGGYGVLDIVPRAWAAAMARIADVGLPQELPGVWLAEAAVHGRVPGATRLTEDAHEGSGQRAEAALAETRRGITRTREALSGRWAL